MCKSNINLVELLFVHVDDNNINDDLHIIDGTQKKKRSEQYKSTTKENALKKKKLSMRQQQQTRAFKGTVIE